MAFSIKNWTNRMVTRLNAAAMEDLEERLSDYADLVAAGGIELGFAQVTSNTTQTGAGVSDVPGLEVTVTVGSRPIVLLLSAQSLVNSSGSGVGYVALQEVTPLTTLGSCIASGTALPLPVARRVRLAPSAGSHTYKVVVGQLVTGNTTLQATALDPASIQVVEV